MRILHVTDTYLPRLGGIELHVSDLAARQQAFGHEVSVLTHEPLLRRVVSPGGAVPVRRLSSGRAGLVTQALSIDRPDLIHAHLSVGSPFTWAVLRAAEAPILASVHSLLPQRSSVVRAGITMAGLPVGRIDFTAVSQVAADRLTPALPAGQQVGVLHNGIDEASWAIDHVETATFHILAVGRLAARKRPLALVEALADFAKLNPELRWTATIVGDGSMRARLAQAVRRRGLSDRVVLAGALDRADIRRLLARTQVFVAPAKLESFGIAALEARCAGVPIVGMADSGVTEFVADEIDGLLADDDRDIASCLTRLATDVDLAAAIRRHNTHAATEMAWDTVVADHERRYAAVVRRVENAGTAR